MTRENQEPACRTTRLNSAYPRADEVVMAFMELVIACMTAALIVAGERMSLELDRLGA